MPKTEITKPGETPLARPRDIFSAMRDEMDRVFGRFERDWPFPSLFGRDGRGAMMVPELDVRENTNSITHRGRAAGRGGEGRLRHARQRRPHHQGREEAGEGGEERELSPDRAQLRQLPALAAPCPTPSTTPRSRRSFDKGVLKVTAAKKPEAVKAERRIEIKKA